MKLTKEDLRGMWIDGYTNFGQIIWRMKTFLSFQGFTWLRFPATGGGVPTGKRGWHVSDKVFRF